MRWAYAVAALVIGSVLVCGIWLPIDYRLWANMALLAVAGLTTIFAALYALRSRWWTNIIGEIYLDKSVIMAMVLLLAAATNWVDDDFPGRQTARFVVYTFGVVAYTTMIITLRRQQRHDQKRREPQRRTRG